MNFLELKTISVRKVFVNMNLVTMIEPMGDRVDDGCVIYFVSPDDILKVSNTYDDVKALMWR